MMNESSAAPPRPQPGPPPEPPRGFRLAGVACGVKSAPGGLDLSLIVADQPSTASGVFTQNQVVGAAVQVTRPRVPAADVRALVINSGNANACTGQLGRENAQRMTVLVAERLGCRAEQVLVCSTGIIGTQLPMQKIEAGISSAFDRLDASSPALESAARGIMTTDTVPKWTQRRIGSRSGIVHVVGFAKGAAMLAPRLATMLAVVLTDAPLTPTDAEAMLRQAAQRSFNCISIDGHASTNDTVLLLASGASKIPSRALDAQQLASAIEEVCTDLAKAIIADAEGGGHRITIDVEGARNEAEAQRMAREIAESPLVKTAIHGADPNWGRIVSAAGYAGVAFREEDVSLWLNATLLYQSGVPVPFNKAALADSLRRNFEVQIRFLLTHGQAAARFWACDLTAEYIRLNADYHT